MNAIAFLRNGTPASGVDPADRGLHYGDGVFRTLRVAGGSARGWEFHLERLAHDCRRLDLPMPSTAELGADLATLFGDGGDGILKIAVTRGVGGRGYAPPEPPIATRLAWRYPAPDYPDAYARDGVTVGICKTRLAVQPALAGVKHLNRLEQVLGRRECSANGWPEGLMLTPDERAISGTMSNLFAVYGSDLCTPAITDAGVIGATRQRLLALCAGHGRAAKQTQLTLSDIQEADEIFLCNSAMPLWPVRRLGERELPVGPVTRWCRERLEAAACGG